MQVEPALLACELYELATGAHADVQHPESVTPIDLAKVLVARVVRRNPGNLCHASLHQTVVETGADPRLEPDVLIHRCDLRLGGEMNRFFDERIATLAPSTSEPGLSL